MAFTKLLNIIALASIAILTSSLGVSHVQAVSLSSRHVPRSPIHQHAAAAALRKRGANGKRCKPRPPPSNGTKPADNKPADNKPVDNKPADNKPADNKPTDNKPTDNNPTDNKPPPPPPPPPSGGNKIGLAWAQDDDRALENFARNGGAGWIYTWSPWIPPKAIELGLQGCLMYWGDKQTSEFLRLSKQANPKNGCILAFNEPNQSGQAQMSPEHAAQLWKDNIQPLKSKGFQLITPACTNAPSGKEWYQKFFAACTGCTFDGLAVHWYGTKTNELFSYLEDMHKTFNLNIWLTEFACQDFSGRNQQCSKDAVWAFMKDFKGWAASTSWLAKYAYFGALHNMGNVNPLNQLLAPNGQPTDLGYFYLQ